MRSQETHTYVCARCGREFTIRYVLCACAKPLCPDCMEASL